MIAIKNAVVGALERPPAPLPADYQAAAIRLVDKQVMQGPRYRDRVIFDHTGLRPEMVDFANALLKEFKRRSMPMIVSCGFRGETAQNKAFREGHSKARFGQSAHNFGMAIDVIHMVHGWNMTRKEWAVIGHIGYEVARKRNLKLQWGGEWDFYDPAHWEMKEWKLLRPLVA